MIRSFANDATRAIFEGRAVKDFPADMQDRALAKLQMLHAAGSLDDLSTIASNKLELLTGDRDGKHCICINDKGRICFRWHEGHAFDVEIFGYH